MRKSQLIRRRLVLLLLCSALLVLLPRILQGWAQGLLRRCIEASSGHEAVIEGFRLSWGGLSIDRVSGRSRGFSLEIRELEMPLGALVRGEALLGRRGRAASCALSRAPSDRRGVGGETTSKPPEFVLRSLLEVKRFEVSWGGPFLDVGPAEVGIGLYGRISDLRVEAAGVVVSALMGAESNHFRVTVSDPAKLAARLPSWRFDRLSNAGAESYDSSLLWPPQSFRLKIPRASGPGLELADLEFHGNRESGVRLLLRLNGGHLRLTGPWPKDPGAAWFLDLEAEDLQIRSSWRLHLARLIPLIAGAPGRIDARLSVSAGLRVKDLFDLRSWLKAEGEGRVRLSEGRLVGGAIVEAAARLVGLSDALSFRPFGADFRVKDGVVSLADTLLIKASALRIRLSGQTDASGALNHKLSFGLETPALVKRWLPRIDREGWLTLSLGGTLEKPQLSLPDESPQSAIDRALKRILRLAK